MQATQASASAPVEVSWSPPSGGAATITGYRIFYGNGESVSVPSVITGISLTLNGNYIGQSVSIRSELAQLSSELINVTVTAVGKSVFSLSSMNLIWLSLQPLTPPCQLLTRIVPVMLQCVHQVALVKLALQWV